RPRRSAASPEDGARGVPRTPPPEGCGSCRETDGNRSSTTSPRHRRQRLPIEVVLQHRRLSPRRPSTAAVRPLAQPALVDANDGAAFFLGFFLISGQRSFFQRRIASSSPSQARPT